MLFVFRASGSRDDEVILNVLGCQVTYWGQTVPADVRCKRLTNTLLHYIT